MVAILGGIELDVIYSEKPERSVKTTDHPVESGQSLVDHVERQPYILNLTGMCSGSGAASKIKQLEELMYSGARVSYAHRNTAKNVVIESFNSVHDTEFGNGYSFTMRLKQIRVAKVSPVSAMKAPTASQVKAAGNKGVQQKQTPKQQKQTKQKTTSKKTPAQLAAENGNHVKGR